MRVVLTGVLGVSLLASGASGLTMSVGAITSNGAASVAQGVAQIGIDVTGIAGGVRFGISNAGPSAFALKNIYWDNSAGVLAGITGLVLSPGTGYTVMSSPGNLPAGNTVGFVSHFAIKADSPPSHNGVNAGETVGIDFSLAGGATFDDVAAALSAGTLRVGMHAIAFANGQSESFVNVPPSDPPETPVIPLPTGAALATAGLVLIGLRRRR